MGAVSVRDHSGLTSLLRSSSSTWPAQAGVGECVPLSSSSWMGLPGGIVPLHCEPLCWGVWLPQDLQTPFSRGGVALHLPSTQASLCASSIAPPQRASPLLSRAVLLAVRYPTGTFRRGLLRSPPTTWSPMCPRLGKTRLLFNFPWEWKHRIPDFWNWSLHFGKIPGNQEALQPHLLDFPELVEGPTGPSDPVGLGGAVQHPR